MRVLVPSEEILQERNRQEVFRAWLDGGMLSVSVCHVFPDSCTRDVAEIWGMLISDIFHHVADAIVLETGRDQEDVREALRAALDEVFRSERGTRRGTLKKIVERRPEISDPDVTGDESCVEIVRIALLPDSIRVMVLVGMWLPDQEESVWGNLLYDIAALVAESLAPERDAETTKSDLIQDVFHYIEHPSTAYSGEFYGTEKGGESRRGTPRDER